jgi:protein required for attachment to host cells
MQQLWIPHDAWILVGDGRKALMLRNAGTPQRLSLEVLDTLTDDANPPTHAQGADRPGRVVQSRTSRRSAVEQTDWHEMAEEKFAATVAARLNRAAQRKQFEQIVLVAPPQTLAALRTELDKETQSRVLAELDKDLTKHPLPEIARLLTGG